MPLIITFNIYIVVTDRKRFFGRRHPSHSLRHHIQRTVTLLVLDVRDNQQYVF